MDPRCGSKQVSRQTAHIPGPLEPVYRGDPWSRCRASESGGGMDSGPWAVRLFSCTVRGMLVPP